MKRTSSDCNELVGQIIDIFEDFLSERHVIIENDERNDPDVDPEDAAIIYGSDYGELQTFIEDTFERWGIINEDGE